MGSSSILLQTGQGMWTSPFHSSFSPCDFNQSFLWQSQTEKSWALKHHRCSLQSPLPSLAWCVWTGMQKNPIMDVLGSPGGGCGTFSAMPFSQEKFCVGSLLCKKHHKHYVSPTCCSCSPLEQHCFVSGQKVLESEMKIHYISICLHNDMKHLIS